MKKEVKKNKKVLYITLAITGLILVGVLVYAWFFYKRQIDTLTWIKTPIRLDIGSGNNHNIAYLDMGAIDAEKEPREASYVFCVYGEPVDMYSLQLSYTTNIPFSYKIYRAELSDEDNHGDVSFTYTDDNGDHTEYFNYKKNKSGEREQPVISAKPLKKMTDTEIKEHQSHKLSYGDENGNNPVKSEKVQKNAEPLYWLASENGLKVLNPVNRKQNLTGEYFLDYFIIDVTWEEGTVINNKETDMVYLTVSR